MIANRQGRRSWRAIDAATSMFLRSDWTKVSELEKKGHREERKKMTYRKENKHNKQSRRKIREKIYITRTQPINTNHNKNNKIGTAIKEKNKNKAPIPAGRGSAVRLAT